MKAEDERDIRKEIRGELEDKRRRTAVRLYGQEREEGKERQKNGSKKY